MHLDFGKLLLINGKLNEKTYRHGKEEYVLLESWDLANPTIVLNFADLKIRKKRRVGFSLTAKWDGHEPVSKVIVCKTADEKVRTKLFSCIISDFSGRKLFKQVAVMEELHALSESAKRQRTVAARRQVTDDQPKRGDDLPSLDSSIEKHLQGGSSSDQKKSLPDWLLYVDYDLADVVEMRQFDSAVQLLTSFRQVPLDVLQRHPNVPRVLQNIGKTEQILTFRLFVAFRSAASMPLFGGLPAAKKHLALLRKLGREYDVII